jgi:amino acid transporter
MVLSIAFGASVYVILNTVTAMVIPEGYSDWSEYIADMPNLDGVLSLPTFHAGQQLLGSWGLLFLGLAVLGAILSGIIGFYMATSRLLYSMSKEKVLPAWFGKLDVRFKTPSNAILFVLAIALVAPFFGRTALGWIVDMSSIGAAIGYGYTSLAAYSFAKKEGDSGVMITGIIGTIMALIFMILLLVPIPMFNCSLGKESYICLVIWIIMGLIFYIRSGK